MIQLTTAAHCLAMMRSRNAIKDELRKRGLKLTQYSAAEITSWAHVWLDDHAAELMPDAIAEARRMILSGVLGKRVQKAFIKELKIEQFEGERSQSNGQL
jgi:ribosome biogenesis SPOUT family RNA methylase Rps3